MKNIHKLRNSHSHDTNENLLCLLQFFLFVDYKHD